MNLFDLSILAPQMVEAVFSNCSDGAKGASELRERYRKKLDEIFPDLKVKLKKYFGQNRDVSKLIQQLEEQLIRSELVAHFDYYNDYRRDAEEDESKDKGKKMKRFFRSLMTIASEFDSYQVVLRIRRRNKEGNQYKQFQVVRAANAKLIFSSELILVHSWLSDVDHEF